MLTRYISAKASFFLIDLLIFPNWDMWVWLSILTKLFPKMVLFTPNCRKQYGPASFDLLTWSAEHTVHNISCQRTCMFVKIDHWYDVYKALLLIYVRVCVWEVA